MENEEIKNKNEQDDDKKKKKLIFIIIGVVIAVALAIVLPITLTKCSTPKYTYTNPTYTWAADYSTCTAERLCNEDSSHNETETKASICTVIVAEDCTNEGTSKFDVAFENTAFEAQSKTVTIPAGHKWGTPTYEWSVDNATCTATAVCTRDASHTVVETANSTYEETTPASYISDGEGTYTATFTNEAFETQTKNVTIEKLAYHGDFPIISEDGKTLTYGLYPQTNVNDSDLVAALNELTTPESNGWYLYNDEYYAKVSANPYKSSYKFDNGTTIESDTTYWFKCEPIVWNVLSNNSGEYYILSSVLLDAHNYYNSASDRTIDGQTVYANNYEYNDIRSWLNDDFYNSAFALNNSYIQTTTVGNSAATTNSTSNSYACNNTQDKVFLPSYKDYINSSYGFSTSTDSTATRCCKTTDWARARGAYYNTGSSYLYNGYYWTRSPHSEYSYGAWYVDGGGDLSSYGRVDDTHSSVRPGLSIKIV